MSTADDRHPSVASARGQRHGSVAEHHVTSVLGAGEVVYDAENPDKEWDADEEVLAALGYRPEFKREFSLFTTFSVSFAVLGLLPSFASTLYYGMGYAGTAGMTWGWLIAMLGIQCIAMSMAEICSAMPTSGGLYYAAAVLAPPGWGPLAAWIVGWSNFFGQITAAPSINYANAAMILAAAAIENPDYTPTNTHTFLLTVFLIIIHTFLAALPTKKIAQFNSAGSTFNMIALIAVIIIIPAATIRERQGLPRFSSNSDVWGTIYKGTEWPDGVSVLMSFLGVIWTLSGYDSPFHLSEECSNANIASPRAIVMTSSIGGTLGWFLQLVVAYTVVSIPDVLDSKLGQPFAAYLQQVLTQKFTIAVLSLSIVAGFFMGSGNMIAASRVTFAYARDDCFPFSSWISKVNKVTKTPVNAVITNSCIGVALVCLIFGGSVTVGALFSIGAIAQFVAFTIPISIRIFFVGNRFRPGPWNLGRFTIPIGSFGCAFVVLMIPIMCLPAEHLPDLQPDTMNWTCLVYGAPMLFITIWWFASAHKWFKGPKVNLEHVMVDQEQRMPHIDGQEFLGKGNSSDDDGLVSGKNDAVMDARSVSVEKEGSLAGS